MSFLDKIFGDPNIKILKEIQPLVDKINALEQEVSAKSQDDLKSRINVLREELQALGGDYDKEKAHLEQILPEVFAIVREASKRVLGKRHFDTQLIGGIALHRGQIAEMKTGEGKTLVATLPLFLNALTGRGVHLVTVNDYLSRVGAGWMAPIYHYLGLSTGVIVHDSALVYDPEYTDDTQYDERLKKFRRVVRKDAYAADITYGTNNEFGFDYLRDNMVSELSQMVQRDLHYAIVDEVDSILIDEARTPLIISAPAEESTDKYYQFAELVSRLTENEDYNVDEKMRSATLTEAGMTKMEQWLGVENIYTTGGIREVHHIEQALKAHALFKNDRDYIVKEGEVIIVDEFTGRLMHGRRYSEGLHQAIEAKENVKIQRESRTLATITFQNYFRMFKKLAGMTGTAVTEAEEFSKIYNLEVLMVPTNKPMIREDMNDLIYRTETAKYRAVIADVKEKNEKGQPVLIGTISIEKNEILALMMEREGLRPQVLNAKNHEKEARIISQAGRYGLITIATNMAGRGVDIMLGGEEPAFAEADGDPLVESEAHKAWKEEREKVLAAGGLYVIGTERHESRRIDNQLRGRSGRQGDPGLSRFYVSMEDDLMRIFGGDRMKNIMTTLKVPEDMPIENKMISKSIESAQKKVEGNNFDMRKHLVDYDDVLNKHRDAIYRKRKDILKSESGSGTNLSEVVLKMVENEVEEVISFHTASEDKREWNIDEIYQNLTTIFPVADSEKKEIFSDFDSGTPKLDLVKLRTEMIEHAYRLAVEKYGHIIEAAKALNIEWSDVERAVLVRSIDTLWIEHLETISILRQGIGLRGYGQRDPLVEYKKEAYTLFNQLNSLIQKEVVYAIYKVGSMDLAGSREMVKPEFDEKKIKFEAPAKEMGEAGHKTYDVIPEKAKNEDGEKVGRNDLCPCGSGKKYKKCHGK